MDDSPEAALRAARNEVIASVHEICDRTRGAVRQGADAIAAARDRVHRLAGIAGVVGLSLVSERALDLEAVLGEGEPTPDQVESGVTALRDALAADLAAPPPPWVE
jgi:HPt (histidine-containing phosphotransfer) domain-containing protein